MQRLSESLKNPIATDLKIKQFTDYRNKQLERGLTISTMNRQLSYLKAVYNQHKKYGQDIVNPLELLKHIRQDEKEFTYLDLEQIEFLLEETQAGVNPDTYKVAKLTLVTGARWSEVELLKKQDILHGKIRFKNTKSGKIRVVPVTQEILDEVIPKNKPRRLFNSCYSSFRSALERTNIELPRGQSSHVLRHTFASHFINEWR